MPSFAERSPTRMVEIDPKRTTFAMGAAVCGVQLI
jgi:hypothetical protein